MFMRILTVYKHYCCSTGGFDVYLQSVFPEKVQGVSKHLNGPDPPTIDRLQLCLHGEVLQQTQS